MATRMKQRRGTELSWTTSDPILEDGELALNTNNGQFKIGDGFSNWSELPYFVGPTGPTGPTGPEGASGLSWEGTWSALTDYAANDAVFHNGASWFAEGNPPVGEEPATLSTYWFPLALQGLPGLPGEDGLDGPPGEAGPAGAVGATGDTGPAGATGATGNTGPVGQRGGTVYYYSGSSTTDSDPGFGNVRFNVSSISSVTWIYINNNVANLGSMTGWYDSWDDSNNPVRGILSIDSSSSESSESLKLSVTGNVVVASGYYKIPVAYLGGSILTGGVVISFSRSGDNAPGYNNVILNSAFDIWQRGTSFTSRDSWTADRFYFLGNGSGVTSTISQVAFTSGAAPLIGYDGRFFLRYNQSAAGSGNTLNILDNIIEDVRTLAGQTVTISFFAKADAARNINVSFRANYGTGGSASVNSFSTPISVTTSWQRYSVTTETAGVSGKTIGANSNLVLRLFLPTNTTQTIDIWGVQLESGSAATPFQRNGANPQAELAACQRYFYRMGGGYGLAGFAAIRSSTLANPFITHPVEMRVTPTFTVSASNAMSIFGTGTYTSTAFGTFATNTRNTVLDVTSSLMPTGDAAIAAITSGQTIDWSAEL
jgi:hypothetical protein